MIKIIIFSDIRIYCEGLSRILTNQAAIEVVDATNSLEDAAPRIEQSMPDMILLDMSMPSSCGFAGQVKQLFPGIKLVAIAVPEDEQNIIECAEAGIAAYVAREATIQELIDTIISANKGEFCCPPRIAAAVFNKVQAMARKAGETYLCVPDSYPDAAFKDLTHREKQVLGLMADGLSNKAIARSLVIEVSTVKNHVHNILVKLEVHSRIQAAALFQSETLPNGLRSTGMGLDSKVYS